MQSSMAISALLGRLSSHAAASCSLIAAHGVWFPAKAQRRYATASVATASSGDQRETGRQPPISLTPEQQQHITRLLSLLERPGHTAQRLGALAHLAVTYRDLSVALSALHMREHGLNPVTDDEADCDQAEQHQLQQQLTAGSAVMAGTQARRGTYLPLKDVTRLPEHVAVDGRSVAPAEPQYQLMHMDKISCWAAMQPNHIEMSQPLMTGINLFPPQEASYPTYVDFDAALRKLSHHVSRKRLKLQRRLLRKQDKYQLKTWDHYPGEA